MQRPIVLFLLLAYGISWTVAGLAYLLGAHYGSGAATTLVGGGVMLGPAIAAILVRRFVERLPLTPLGLSLAKTNWKWMGITAVAGGLFMPLGLLYNALLGRLTGSPLFGRTELSMDMLRAKLAALLDEQGLAAAAGQLDALGNIPVWSVLLLIVLGGMVSAFTVNVPFMFGEEFGWRGHLYHHTRRWPPVKAVLFTGVVWGLWHAPLIVQGHNYPGYPLTGVLFMVLFTTVLAFPFHLVRQRTNSVWGPCVLHGMINSTAAGLFLFTDGGHVMVASIAGLSGLLSFVTVSLLLCAVALRWPGNEAEKPEAAMVA